MGQPWGLQSCKLTARYGKAMNTIESPKNADHFPRDFPWENPWFSTSFCMFSPEYLPNGAIFAQAHCSTSF
jgi:hypothetical protein